MKKKKCSLAVMKNDENTFRPIDLKGDLLRPIVID